LPPLQGTSPKDIQRCIDNADFCEHMDGEFDSEQSKPRRRSVNYAW